MMHSPVVIVGVGEMGGVFARGILKLGHPVYPVTRDMKMQDVATLLPKPHAVIIAVGEGNIHEKLMDIPEIWQDKIVLLQNELLPADWLQHGLSQVTTISVWFEKKPGQDFKVIIPSPVFGPLAGLIHDALGALGIPVNVLSSPDALLHELVCKNVYILTTNIAGLQVGGNVGDLWAQNEPLARAVANDVIDIQEWLTHQEFDRESLIQSMLNAIKGDLSHQCMGRSAPGRLTRAIALADEAGLSVNKLREINEQVR